jgi:hypothetical protein
MIKFVFHFTLKQIKFEGNLLYSHKSESIRKAMYSLDTGWGLVLNEHEVTYVMNWYACCADMHIWYACCAENREFPESSQQI